ncbi:MAG TPA: hypothetical protein VHQ45_13490 [Gemmatimonadaceae bacterium]|jgi:hypothetical protein|nr:hypothetical protein [Gemmatimonadaceae bacterium]
MAKKEYVAPDGTRWRIEIRTPGASSALVVFHHPAGGTARYDRYATYQWKGAEARNVTARLDKDEVMDALGDGDLLALFRRSAPITTAY